MRCQVDNSALDVVLRHLTAVGVRSLVCRPPTLEELFLRHYSADPGADGPGEPGEHAGVAGGERQ